MKRKIKWIISLSLIAGILCFLYFLLPYPRKVWMIAHYLKSFPTRAYSVSHWGIIQNDSSETDILSFECHIYRNDEILENVLELKKDLEAYLADNAELYHNTTITLHFETDAADLDYVLTTSGSNAKNPLLFGYGVFHDGELHSLEAFRNTSEFISLELVSTSNPNNRHFDYTALDNQTELEMLHLENMNLSADQLQYLIDKHPNCKIKASVKNE